MCPEHIEGNMCSEHIDDHRSHGQIQIIIVKIIHAWLSLNKSIRSDRVWGWELRLLNGGLVIGGLS